VGRSTSDEEMNQSTRQHELYEAMKKGVIIHHIKGRDSYYFRTDTMKRCTAQARALRKSGLVEAYSEDWRGCKLRVKPTK
jgi:K+/H+ antiporter YhaU regulatory subunit KhtT